tara:strand:+ start:2466 stop:2594 length:129 start_codon:yes stop_codon:yes gene_type:complete
MSGITLIMDELIIIAIVKHAFDKNNIDLDSVESKPSILVRAI